MLDRYARQLIDLPLNQIGRGLAARGFTANGVTLIGLGLGLFAALLIAGSGLSSHRTNAPFSCTCSAPRCQWPRDVLFPHWQKTKLKNENE